MFRRFIFLSLISVSSLAYSTSFEIMRESFSGDSHSQHVEFRKCTEECESPRWYVSFLDTSFIKEIYLQGKQIRSFEHPNLGGKSYFIEGNTGPLEEALKVRPLYSVWDSVQCEAMTFILKDDMRKLFFAVQDLKKCATEWND